MVDGGVGVLVFSAHCAPPTIKVYLFPSYLESHSHIAYTYRSIANAIRDFACTNHKYNNVYWRWIFLHFFGRWREEKRLEDLTATAGSSDFVWWPTIFLCSVILCSIWHTHSDVWHQPLLAHSFFMHVFPVCWSRMRRRRRTNARKKKKEAIVPSHDLHTFFAPFSQRFHLAPLRHASTRRGAPYTLSVSKTSSGARWIYSTRNFAINIFFFYSSVIFSGFTSFPNRVHWLGWNVIHSRRRHSIAESKCNIRQEVLVSLAMAKWSYRRRHHRRHLYIQLNTHHSTWWHSDAPKASSSFADKTFSHSISNSKSIIIMAWVW